METGNQRNMILRPYRVAVRKRQAAECDQPGEGRRSAAGTLTVGLSLCVLLVALAMLIRLALIDQRPLSTSESSLALESFQILQDRPPETLQQGPLTAYASALSQGLFAGGDGSARLPGVLFGTLLAAMPFFLRRQLGTATALLAVAGLALSPLAVFASRSVSGGVAAPALGLLLWCLLSGGPSAVGRYRASAAAVALGALVASGPEGITVLVSASLAALLASPHPIDILKRWRAAASEPELRHAPLVLAGTLLVIGTGFGTNLGTMRAILADNWVQWAGSFGLTGTRGGPILILLLYELPVVSLGLVQLLRTMMRRDVTDAFLALWAMLLLLTSLLQTGELLPRLVLPLVPLYLLAARLVTDSLSVASQKGTGWRWVLSAVAVAVPLAVAIVLLNRGSTPGADIPSPFLYGELALVGVALLAVNVLIPWRSRMALLWWVGAVASMAFLIHGMVFLNFRPDTLEREPAVGTQASSYLRAAAQEASYFSRYFATQVRIDPTLRPAAQWYLREARDVQYTSDPGQALYIGVAQQSRSQEQADMQVWPGSWQPALDAREFTWQGVWRWLVDRGGLVRPNQRDIIVRTPSGNW